MSVVAIISVKGGAGKSTVGVHLTVAAAMRKRNPVVFDYDKKQLSLLLWAKGLRKKVKKPAFVRGNFETLVGDLEAAKRKHDLVIIDVGAGGGDEVRDIASVAEHILIPVRASAFDIAATSKTIDMLRNCADNTEPEEIAYRNALGKAAIVLNCTPRKPSTKWRAEVNGALESCGAGGVPVIGALADREAYSTAIENGHGVTEEREDADAVAEILALYEGLLELESERAKKLKRVRRGK